MFNCLISEKISNFVAQTVRKPRLWVRGRWADIMKSVYPR